MARGGSRGSGRGRSRGAETAGRVKTPPPRRNAAFERARRWANSPWPIVVGLCAVELFVIAIGIGPWLNDRHREAGRRLAAEHRYAEAIPEYLYLLRRYPLSPTVNLELGLVYLNAGDYERAVGRLSVAAQGPNPPAGIHSKIGEAYEGMGEGDKALLEFIAAQKENNKDPIACYYLGLRAMEKGDWVEASNLLERAAFNSKVGPKAREKLKEVEKKIFAAPHSSG